MLQMSVLSLWLNAAGITPEHVAVNSLELFHKMFKFSQLVKFLISSKVWVFVPWNLSFEIPHMYDVQAILRLRLFYS
jgi:hypothetical protein